MLTGAQTNLFKPDTCDNNLFLDILDDSNEKTEDKAVFFSCFRRDSGTHIVQLHAYELNRS